MKALGTSYLKFFVSRQRENERVALSSTDFALNRHDFGFLIHQKRVGGGLVLFKAKCVGSISSPSFSSQTNLGSEVIQTVNFDQPKTVRVRFKLHKQCAFGQQFLVVGDDPSLGLWDPCDGVPLNWSEGHVWTAEVDMPSSKVINYKFILDEIDGTVSWQPGPDRVLETWDTAKMISVSEDWDSPDFQSIVEEEFVNDSGFLIAESLDQTLVEQRNDVMEELVDVNDLGLSIAENWNKGEVEEGNDVMKERVDANERRSDHLDEPSMLMVAENISEEQDLSMSDEGCGLMSGETTLGDHGRVVINGSDLSGLKNETWLVIDEGVPVLVPGLATLPVEEVEAEEAEAEAEASSIIRSTTVVVSEEIVEVATTAFDEIKDSTDLNQINNKIIEGTATESDEIEELNDLNQRNNNVVEDTTTESETETEAATKPEIRVSAALHYAETSEMTEAEEKMRLNGKKQILDNDMQWGRRTLHKFLANLGFMQHR